MERRPAPFPRLTTTVHSPLMLRSEGVPAYTISKATVREAPTGGLFKLSSISKTAVWTALGTLGSFGISRRSAYRQPSQSIHRQVGDLINFSNGTGPQGRLDGA